jgi:hypothetical protein
VLESIRDLMNEETIIPEWLTNIFLGYGDPAGAQYTSIVEEQPELFIPVVDFKDTFLDSDHLAKSFPGTPPPPPCRTFNRHSVLVSGVLTFSLEIEPINRPQFVKSIRKKKSQESEPHCLMYETAIFHWS